MIAENFARCIGRKQMEFHIGLTNLIYNLCVSNFRIGSYLPWDKSVQQRQKGSAGVLIKGFQAKLGTDISLRHKKEPASSCEETGLSLGVLYEVKIERGEIT